jgi:hypothetical protein
MPHFRWRNLESSMAASLGISGSNVNGGPFQLSDWLEGRFRTFSSLLERRNHHGP